MLRLILARSGEEFYPLDRQPIADRASKHPTLWLRLVAYGLIFWVGLHLGDARTMLFTNIVLHAFTHVMIVRQLNKLSLWPNRALLWSYGAAVVLQFLALYTPLRNLCGIVPLDWRAWPQWFRSSSCHHWPVFT